CELYNSSFVSFSWKLIFSSLGTHQNGFKTENL
ncbi:hypothetical protein TNIN_399381, partial [Trichonephila inaurata madagascariensis]